MSQDSTAQDSQFESDGRLTVGTDDCLIDEAWGEDAELAWQNSWQQTKHETIVCPALGLKMGTVDSSSSQQRNTSVSVQPQCQKLGLSTVSFTLECATLRQCHFGRRDTLKTVTQFHFGMCDILKTVRQSDSGMCDTLKTVKQFDFGMCDILKTVRQFDFGLCNTLKTVTQFDFGMCDTLKTVRLFDFGTSSTSKIVSATG